MERLNTCFHSSLLTAVVVMFAMTMFAAEAAYSMADATEDSQSVTDPLGFLSTDTAALEKAAREAYNAGEYEKAAECYIEYLKFNITDASNIYNLACCYGLSGDAETAAKCLELAYAAGFDSIGQIEGDKDFDSVRESDVFKETVEKIKADAEAKAAEAGELVHVTSQAYFDCLVRLPEGYDPDKEYTLVVGLHGYGSNHERFVGLWSRFENPQFIFAVPQAQYRFGAGAEPMRSWGCETALSEEEYWQSQALAESYVCEAVSTLKAKYKVGDVYLLGFSQGCFMTYMTGIRHSELFKGLICFGGWLNSEGLGEDALNGANHLRVFVAHGTEDRMVEFEAGQNALECLKSHGYDATFFEFTGGHTVPVEALKEVQVWMAQA